jgi:hypothetical protein
MRECKVSKDHAGAHRGLVETVVVGQKLLGVLVRHHHKAIVQSARSRVRRGLLEHRRHNRVFVAFALLTVLVEDGFELHIADDVARQKHEMGFDDFCFVKIPQCVSLETGRGKHQKLMRKLQLDFLTVLRQLS